MHRCQAPAVDISRNCPLLMDNKYWIVVFKNEKSPLEVDITNY